MTLRFIGIRGSEIENVTDHRKDAGVQMNLGNCRDLEPSRIEIKLEDNRTTYYFVPGSTPTKDSRNQSNKEK